MYALSPDLIFLENTFHKNRHVVIGEDGRISQITASLPPEMKRTRLPGKALIPGMVNGHSHAFQRAIRGRTHERREGLSDFWSWRNAMYAVVEKLSPKSIYGISRHAFLEMLSAGYTSVGEFHYIHHQEDGIPYGEENELANAVIQAALDVGIRIVLLRVLYLETGYKALSPAPGQLRFMDGNLEEGITRIERLQAQWREARNVHIGVAPHSVRAIHERDLRALATWRGEHAVPLHIHASEQVAEVEETLAFTGKRPVELLEDTGILTPATTLVHATHLNSRERESIGRAGASVCVCPTTEADLGDGLIEATPLAALGVPFTLGSDSQAIIDPFQEMKALEMHERLRIRARGALTTVGSLPGLNLFQSATTHGYRSLGLSGGAIEPGTEADLVAVDLEHPALLGLQKEELLAGLTMHGDRSAVTDVWVSGKHLISGKKHGLSRESQERFLEIQNEIFSG